MILRPRRFSGNRSLAKRRAGGICFNGEARSDLMFRRIDHVAIHVSDLDRSVAFYEQRFGFEKYFQHAATGGMQIAYLKLGDTVLELTHKSDGPMKGFHFCLEAENFDAAVDALKK